MEYKPLNNSEKNVIVHQGVVKWFNHQRGFGFIHNIDNSDHSDVFVHHTKLKTTVSTYKTLYKGEYVEYTIVSDNGKDCADEVTGIRGLALMCEANHDNDRTNSLSIAR